MHRTILEAAHEQGGNDQAEVEDGHARADSVEREKRASAPTGRRRPCSRGTAKGVRERGRRILQPRRLEGALGTTRGVLMTTNVREYQIG